MKRPRGLSSRVVRGFQARVNYDIRISIGTRRFRLPRIKGLGLSREVSERWMLEVLQILFELKQGSFVDVGANVGQTLLKLRAVDESTFYIGFEPNPHCVFLLNELIELNGLRHCVIVPTALGTSEGIVELDMSNANCIDDGATIIQGFRPTDLDRKSKQLVPIVRFDTVAEMVGHRPIAIVKIDVEGGESEVMNGMLETLRNERPFLIMEVLPVYRESNQFRLLRQEALEAELQTLGYQLLRVEKLDGSFRSLTKIPKIGVHSDLQGCDYIAVPEEYVSAVQDKVAAKKKNS